MHRRAAASEGGGAADPDRDGHLADPGAAAPRPARRASPRRSGTSTSPSAASNARAGARLAFGEDVAVRYHVDRADVILALDADFLDRRPRPAPLRPRVRRPSRAAATATMNRLYVVEPTPTDHRRDGRPPPGRRRRTRSPTSRRRSRRELGVKVGAAGRRPSPRRSDAGSTRWRATCKAHRGRAWSWRARRQPPFVHALAHAMNEALGNVGKTVDYLEPVEAEPVDQVASLRELVARHGGGQGRAAPDPGGQPGLQRAGGPRLRQGARRRSGSAPTSACTTTRPRRPATGTSPRRTRSRPGATPGRSTARRRSSSP